MIAHCSVFRRSGALFNASMLRLKKRSFAPPPHGFPRFIAIDLSVKHRSSSSPRHIRENRAFHPQLSLASRWAGDAIALASIPIRETHRKRRPGAILTPATPLPLAPKRPLFSLPFSYVGMPKIALPTSIAMPAGICFKTGTFFVRFS